MPLLPIDDAERARDQVERQRVTQQARRTATPRLSVTTPEERFRAVERRFAVPTLEQRRAQEDDGGLLGRIGGVARSLVEPAVRTGLSVTPFAPLVQAQGVGQVALQHAARPAGATIGGLAGETPAESVRGAIAGFRDPEAGLRRGRDIGFVRHLPDEDVVGEFSPRDIAGGAAGVVLDPLNLVPVVGFGPEIARGTRAAGRAAQRAGRGVLEAGAEQAIRRAEGPLETSTRGILRPLRPREVREFVPQPDLPVGRRANPEVIAERRWFHGSGTPALAPETLSSQQSKEFSLFGPGLYLTDNPRVAATYAMQGADPTVYEAAVGPLRVFDADAPLEPAVRKAMQSFLAQVRSELATSREPLFTRASAGDLSAARRLDELERIDDFLTRIDSGLADLRLGDVPIQNGDILQQAVAAARRMRRPDLVRQFASHLQEAGFDGLTHTGGLRAGGPDAARHQVLVLFQPERGGVRQFAGRPPEEAAAALETVRRIEPSPGAVEPVIPGVTPRGRARVAGAAEEPVTPRPGMGILDLPPGTARERLTSPVNETVQRLTNLIREAVPVREQTELLKSRELSQRAARVAERIQRGGATEEAFRTARGELAGQLPRARFEAPRPALAQEEVDSLFRRIEEYPGFDRLPLSKINAAEALTKTLGGELPTRGEIAILEQVFGEQLAQAILSKRTLGRRAWETFVDATGLPRALKASMDISAPLRQGVLLIRRPEWWKAWGPQIKAFGSERYAREMDEVLKIGPKAERRANFGLELTDLGGAANRLTSREEGFMSRLAEKIPGIRQSQRAYTTFLNKLRADVFDSRAARFDRMVENGQMTVQQRDAELANLAKWLNIATGRAHLSQRVAHSDTMLLAQRLFFSPRLNISRAQAFEMAGRVVTGRGVTPQMRRDIALDFAGFVGTGTGVLALLNQAGVWDVELDPRSSDFAKGRVGALRFDPWGGFQQIVRYAAQAVAGESRSTTTGEPREVDRIELVKRFLRSKLDPGIPALVVDLATGETFVGEDLDFQTSQGLTEEARRRFLPLSIDDVLEAASLEGNRAGIVTIPAGVLGLGVTAFRNVGDVQNEVAIERFNQPYNRLNQGQRNTVNDDPRVQEQLATLERDVGSPREQVAQAFADWERVTTEAEAVLRAKLDAGVTGAARKRAISEFKERRFIAGDALFNNPTVAEELAKGDVPIEDALAERYWSIQPEENIATGNLDFATRDAQRARVLEEAQRLGVDLDYITGSGEGTYRGKRFEDPVVRQAIEQQEQTVDALAASGFFDIRDRVWQRVADRTGLPYADPDELYNEILRRVQDRGVDPARAMVVTNDIYNDLDAVKVWRDVSNDVEQAWIEMNPDLARRAIEFGYLQPGSLRQEEERAVLE